MHDLEDHLREIGHENLHLAPEQIAKTYYEYMKEMASFNIDPSV